MRSFISAMPPSDLVRRLVVSFNYRLVPLPFGDAFRLTALQHTAHFAPVEGIRREHIVDATIPAYAYEASPVVPPGPIATLGLRVLVVTNAGTNRATVVKLLDRMIASRFAEAMQPSLDAGIVRQHAELPWHPGALDYRRRDEPLITGEGHRRDFQRLAGHSTGRRSASVALGVAAEPRLDPPRASI